jgi:hypothetical protein
LISPFDLGIAYHGLLEPEELSECLALYLESLDRREASIRNSLQEKGKSYVVTALFTRPLAHVKAEREWVKQFKEDMERRYNCGEIGD